MASKPHTSIRLSLPGKWPVEGLPREKMDARSDLREARTPPGAYPVGRAQLLRASWPRGELPGMAVTAAVIEVALDPPIRGMDPLVSEVCGRPLSRVPVIRIYGPWGPGGPHCCLNLHGLFPYFYVPVPPEAYGNGAPSFLRAFARRLVLQADRLMASTARSSRGSRLVRGGGCGQSYVGDGLGPGGRTNLSGEPPPLVHKIEVVKRLPFYGYHREFHAFLKISLTIPSMVGPLAGLLLQGIVTGSPLQPFEVHLNFQTQVLADLHLRGMSPVFVWKPLYRAPVPLHPLDAAGIKVHSQGNPQFGPLRAPSLGPHHILSGVTKEIQQDEAPNICRNVCGGLVSRELEMLGIGAPKTLDALGWGKLLHQMQQLELTNTAKPTAATSGSSDTDGAIDCSSKSSGCGDNTRNFDSISGLCELLMKAIPPKGPQGLGFLKAPRRSKCMIEADARAEQILNPIVAAERADAEATAAPKHEQHQTHGELPCMQQKLQRQHSQASAFSVNDIIEGSNSTRHSSNAFAARLLGSVADYWREEAIRASALGLPPPSASDWGPHAGGRDPEGAIAPETLRMALRDIMQRINTWRQQQQQQQPLQRFPVQMNFGKSDMPQPKHQQQLQRQPATPIVGCCLSQNWETSQVLDASNPDMQGDESASMEYAAEGPPVGESCVQSWGTRERCISGLSQRQHESLRGLCSSQISTNVPQYLIEGLPPSQKASVGLQPASEAILPTSESFLDIANIGDEAFAALLASQGSVGPHADAESLGGAFDEQPGSRRVRDPVAEEDRAFSGGSNADCSSLSDNDSRRRMKNSQDASPSPRRRRETSPRMCADNRSGQWTSRSGKRNECSSCELSSERKRCSSDFEDSLQACEARKVPAEGVGRPHRSCSSSCISAAAAVATSSAARSSHLGRSLWARHAQYASAGHSAGSKATATAAQAQVAASPVPSTTFVTRVSAVAADGSEPTSSSSSYTPTVKLGPRSSCEDLSPTQPMKSAPRFQGNSLQAARATVAAARTGKSGAARDVQKKDDGPSRKNDDHSSNSSSNSDQYGPSKIRSPVGDRKDNAASESNDPIITISPTPDAGTERPGSEVTALEAADQEEEIYPFYSNPRDVPSAINPLKATPGGRLQQQQGGLTAPMCACVEIAKTITTNATTTDGESLVFERAEYQTELLRFLHQQQRLQKPRRYELQKRRQQQSNRCCFVYFRPPPDVAQVYASCPLRVRRKWQRTVQKRLQQQLLQQQLLQQHQQQSSSAQTKHGAALHHVNEKCCDGKQLLELQQQQQQSRETIELLPIRQQPKDPKPSDAGSSCQGKSRNSGNNNSDSDRNRPKARMATRLDNHGRIVSYVAPLPQQMDSSAVAITSQSSGSSSQNEQSSQVSVASEVLRAKKGLSEQRAEGPRDVRNAGRSVQGHQAASYGSLIALEVITECPVATATEAAAAAATPNPSTCSVLAVCFVLRDERLQLSVARLQQQQKELSYSDVNGVIIYDPVGSTGSSWQPPFSVGFSHNPGEDLVLGCIDSCVDRRWWRCVVTSERELLLQFCSVVAAADPSLMLMWEEGGRGLKFLGRRADALGIGQLFRTRCSRRADDVSSVCMFDPFSTAAASGFQGAHAAFEAPRAAGSTRGSKETGAAKKPEVRRRRRWVRGASVVPGRLVLEGWRLMQKEMKLQHSDLSGVAADVLGVIVPSIPPSVVAATWKQAQQTRRRNKILQLHQQHQQQCQQRQDELWALQSIADLLAYVMKRVCLCVRLMDSCEVLPRTCELARLYGCCLHSALTRGSQFKVENILLRATKRMNCVLVSPSKQQVTEQPATVGVPLVLEPLSGFYFSPVLVLDFLSLYPSIVIANNICYSTCLGSVEVDPLESEMKTLGVLTVHTPPQIFAQVIQAHAEANAAGPFSWPSSGTPEEEPMRVLPGGSIFVSRRVRQGILPALLNDILQTRLMVKQAAKRYQGEGYADQALLRKLDYRQFGLKMIANVTYGYTNANVSGRMPCADVADAIVETARATLIRAMQLIEQTQKWKARVLYGDTDSIFVLLKGRSLEAAFAIGKEIADAVTRSNPAPITLQLEKVFLPCCLVTKKRYVGNAYLSPSGPPTFDAKGVETIRRDQCPLTSALLENSLRTFFLTRDLSKVKQLLCRQWSKILRGQVPISHFIFHRKAKLGTYRAETGNAPAGTLPPQAKVLYERLHQQGSTGGCATETYGMRVPFVFSQVAGDTDVPLGASGAAHKGVSSRLVDCATAPENVWGGRRDYKAVQALLRGRVQPSIKPLSLLLQPEEDLHEQHEEQQQQHPVSYLHYRYYITKQIIPAIDRLFSLLPPPASVDLLQWFRDMSKPAQRLAALSICRAAALPQQQQQRHQQQSLLQQLGIRSLTAGGSTRERLVLQRFFAGASCLFCGSRCRLLGPTCLSPTYKDIVSPVENKRRKVGRSFAEIEEVSTRSNLIRQLLQKGFSSSSSSDDAEQDEPDHHKLPKISEGRRKTTDLTKREVVLVPPPVCKDCSSSPGLVCMRLYQKLNRVERRLAAAADVCRHCAGLGKYRLRVEDAFCEFRIARGGSPAGSRLCAEGCLHAWHCDVYYRRNAEAEKLKVLQHQMKNLGIFADR